MKVDSEREDWPRTRRCEGSLLSAYLVTLCVIIELDLRRFGCGNEQDLEHTSIHHSLKAVLRTLLTNVHDKAGFLLLFQHCW